MQDLPKHIKALDIPCVCTKQQGVIGGIKLPNGYCDSRKSTTSSSLPCGLYSLPNRGHLYCVDGTVREEMVMFEFLGEPHNTKTNCFGTFDLQLCKSYSHILHILSSHYGHYHNGTIGLCSREGKIWTQLCRPGVR